MDGHLGASPRAPGWAWRQAQRGEGSVLEGANLPEKGESGEDSMALKDLERLALELELLMEVLRRTPERPVRRQIQHKACSIFRRIRSNEVGNG